MPPLSPAASVPSTGANSSLPPSGKKEPEIVVIPEKFYGMALKMSAPPPAEQMSPPPTPKVPSKPTPLPLSSVVAPLPRYSTLPMVLVVIGLVLMVGGVFAYLNRDLLFRKPTPTTITSPPVVITPPAAPENLTATTSGSAVALAWIDTATNETGYRLERREGQGTYLPLTTLPANSNAFLDVSVDKGKTYSYHVVVLNEGGQSSPSNEATIDIPAAPPPPQVTPTLPPGGLDSDSDGLSDAEEPLYGTDVHNPDSDGDGFLDGNEVFHLYNPAAKAPVRLLDSGLVMAFSGPAGWSLYIPTKWKGTLDRPDGSQATVMTGGGETFEIVIEDNPEHQALLPWYLGKNPGVISSSVRSFTTKGGLEGILGADRLDAYFAWDGKIFSLRYVLNAQPYENFRTTFEMMLNSLRLVGAPVVNTPSTQIESGGPGALIGVPPSPTGQTSSTAEEATSSTIFPSAPSSSQP